MKIAIRKGMSIISSKSMMTDHSNKQVYLLQHSYLENDCEETKIIGIFTTEERAIEVLKEYKQVRGFRDYPDCFYIDVYELDRQFWIEGFIRSDV